MRKLRFFPELVEASAQQIQSMGVLKLQVPMSVLGPLKFVKLWRHIPERRPVRSTSQSDVKASFDEFVTNSEIVEELSCQGCTMLGAVGAQFCGLLRTSIVSIQKSVEHLETCMLRLCHGLGPECLECC